MLAAGAIPDLIGADGRLAQRPGPLRRRHAPSVRACAGSSQPRSRRSSHAFRENRPRARSRQRAQAFAPAPDDFGHWRSRPRCASACGTCAFPPRIERSSPQSTAPASALATSLVRPWAALAAGARAARRPDVRRPRVRPRLVGRDDRGCASSRWLRRLPPGFSEIYMHPATRLRFPGAAEGYRYVEESEALRAPEVAAALASTGAVRGGFSDFATGETPVEARGGYRFRAPARA